MPDDGRREIILTVRDLDLINVTFEPNHRPMVDLYKKAAGFRGLANYETYCVYQHLRRYPGKFQWRDEAEYVNRQSVYKNEKLDTSQYEDARIRFGSLLRELFRDQAESFALNPLSKTLLFSSIDRVNWDNLSEFLLDHTRLKGWPQKGANILAFPSAAPKPDNQMSSKD